MKTDGSRRSGGGGSGDGVSGPLTNGDGGPFTNGDRGDTGEHSGEGDDSANDGCEREKKLTEKSAGAEEKIGTKGMEYDKEGEDDEEEGDGDDGNKKISAEMERKAALLVCWQIVAKDERNALWHRLCLLGKENRSQTNNKQ